jgi:MFS family permease
MFSRRLKSGVFVLEGLNSFATVYYFYYFYFYMQKAFGFGNKANLLLAALNGATYAVASWYAGKFAQRFGYFTALKLGFLLMLGALAAGSRLGGAAGQVAVMVAAVVGMSFTWPTLEALVSEGESGEGLQKMVGLYNVVWATTAAIGSFAGGAMLDYLGLKSLFYVPMGIQVCQFALTCWLDARARGAIPAHQPVVRLSAIPELAPEPRTRSRTFLRMAWIANPFAYIAINTLIAVIPGVASRMALSTMLAGFVCSVWCFSRLAAFLALWLWDGWHYRFGWLFGSFLALIASFAVILMVPSLVVLVLAQLVFGLAVGLLYYSSLYYSMDIGDTKGEHGGIHEAAIGLGNFAGPTVGAASLHFLPQYTNSGALAVSFLLLLGLGGLVAVWRNGKPRAS